MLKLTAKQTPWSGVVGGGLQLVDQTGRTRFMVMICGVSDGITKEENAAISAALASAVNEQPIELAERAA